MPQEAGTISNRLEEEQIDFHYAELHAIRFDGTWTSKENNADARQRTFLLFSSEQLAQAGVDVKHPDEDEAIYHNTRAIIEGWSFISERSTIQSNKRRRNATNCL
ncbi:bacitracin export permease protein BceB [Geomicrobium sp. JCM 19037]|nr:bacitracin export permease protein BceB [Geomicrobium sp. JCM 19037]